MLYTKVTFWIKDTNSYYDVTILKNKKGNISVDFSGTPSDQQYIRNNN